MLATLGSLVLDDDLALTPVRPRDAADVFALVDRNRPFLRQWLPWVDDTEAERDSARFIRAAAAMQKDGAGVWFGIWYRHVLAGVVGYNHLNWDDRKTDMGYWLGEAFQGRGLMLRACTRLVELAFGDLKLHRIQILCAPANVRSRRVAERMGFIQEGILKEAEWLYDHFEDSVLYARIQ